MELIVEDLLVILLWIGLGLTAFYPELRWLGIIPTLLTCLTILALLNSFLKDLSIVFIQNILTFGYSSLRGKMSALPAYLIGANLGGGIKGMKNLPSFQIIFYFIVLFLILVFIPPSL